MPLFCSVHSPLTFSFIVVWRVLSKNQNINSTQERSETTTTSTADVKCCSKPLMAYLWWEIWTLFCSVHSLINFIFNGVWWLFLKNNHQTPFKMKFIREWTEQNNVQSSHRKYAIRGFEQHLNSAVDVAAVFFFVMLLQRRFE